MRAAGLCYCSDSHSAQQPLKGNYRSCKHTVHTYADVLPIKGFFLRSVSLGQSTFHAEGGVVVWEIVWYNSHLLHHKNVTVFASLERKDTLSCTHSPSLLHTDVVVLITSICLKLRESAASCWFHRHVKTPLFFPLPSFSPSLSPLFFTPTFFTNSPCPLINPFS